MSNQEQAQQVFVIADDPIEAGMLALDLVHAGLAAQAVRDGATLAAQLQAAAGGKQPALIAAFREGLMRGAEGNLPAALQNEQRLMARIRAESTTGSKAP